ncbi:MAG: DUF1007 family protein [Tateyamaria sp.]
MVMTFRASLCAAIAAASLGAPAAAHPHVFVDTGLKVIVDDAGVFQGVEVTWSYDDFYSLLLLSDLGLDPDGDGTLTEAELRQLDGVDLQWVAGFEGDTYVSRANGTSVRLGKPQSRGVSVKDGRITTVHFRPARRTQPANALIVKAYDPTFYTAYDLIGSVPITGPCTTNILPADLDAAYTLAEELLYAMPTSDAVDAFPEVGEAFADTVIVTCSG